MNLQIMQNSHQLHLSCQNDTGPGIDYIKPTIPSYPDWKFVPKINL